MRPKIIAEVGCNHQGSIEKAKKLIETAAQCGVDFIKFQKRDCEYHRDLNDDWLKPHPNGDHAFGATYYEHRKALEFSIEQHVLLKQICLKNFVKYACSVWDVNSAVEMIDLDPDYIKVPSAMNTNKELLEVLLDVYKGDVHISLGMTTKAEIKRLMNYCRPYRKRLVFYHCVSGYPVAFEDCCINEIDKIIGYRKGYSGHHLGIALDIATLPKGVEFIERHFTLDRTMKGTDHAASLEPQGMAKLVRDVSNVYEALRDKPSELLDVEIEQRRKLKWKT